MNVKAFETTKTKTILIIIVLYVLTTSISYATGAEDKARVNTLEKQIGSSVSRNLPSSSYGDSFQEPISRQRNIGNAGEKELKNNRFATLTTLSGKTFKNVKVTKRSGTKLTLMHTTGNAHIFVHDLPEEAKEQLGLPPVHIMEREDKTIATQKRRKAEQKRLAHKKRRDEWRALPKTIRDYILRCRAEKKLLNMPYGRPREGHVGLLESDTGRVILILNEKEMIVTLNYRYPTGQYSYAPWGELKMGLGSKKCTAWIRGVSTHGFIDGERVSLKSVYQMTGTKTYETAFGGTKTVIVLEPVDVSQYLR